MCVTMPATGAAATSRVGIRALRQNLSVYLRRICRGERFEVTDHGRPVALLIPLTGNESPLARLIAQGRASSPKGDLLDLDPPGAQPSTDVTAVLTADRDDRL